MELIHKGQRWNGMVCTKPDQYLTYWNYVTNYGHKINNNLFLSIHNVILCKFTESAQIKFPPYSTLSKLWSIHVYTLYTCLLQWVGNSWAYYTIVAQKETIVPKDRSDFLDYTQHLTNSSEIQTSWHLLTPTIQGLGWLGGILDHHFDYLGVEPCNYNHQLDYPEHNLHSDYTGVEPCNFYCTVLEVLNGAWYCCNAHNTCLHIHAHHLYMCSCN